MDAAPRGSRAAQSCRSAKALLPSYRSPVSSHGPEPLISIDTILSSATVASRNALTLPSFCHNCQMRSLMVAIPQVVYVMTLDELLANASGPRAEAGKNHGGVTESGCGFK